MDSGEIIAALQKSPEEVMLEMRAELYKRAKGYDVEEVTKSTGPDGPRVVIKKRHIPGDPHAMVEYMRLFGNDNGGWS